MLKKRDVKKCIILATAVLLCRNIMSYADQTAEETTEETVDVQETEQETTSQEETEPETSAKYDPYLPEESVIESGSAAEDETQESGGNNGFHGYSTYREYLASMKQETLSQEQIDAGYQLIDGYPVAPENLPGDPGNDGTNEDGINQYAITKTPDPVAGLTASVTFAGTLPEGVHDSIMIELTNIYTYESYLIYLEEYNHLSATWNLPDGTYMFDILKLQHDSEGKYAPDGYSDENLTVKAGNPMVVKLSFRESSTKNERQWDSEDSRQPETSEEAAIETSRNETQENSENIDQNKNEKKEKEPRTFPMPVRIIILIILCIVPAVIMIKVVQIWLDHKEI